MTDPRIIGITSPPQGVKLGSAQKQIAVLQRTGGGGSGGGASTLAGDTAGPSSANVVTKASGHFKIKGPRPWIDVTHPDYGANGDSASAGWATSDLGLILQAAHDALPAAGGTIVIPEGYYRMTTMVTITKPVKILGAGCGVYNNAAATSYWNPQTKIRWQNATDAAFFVNNVFGVEISGFFLDGANVATLGFDLKAASYGTYKQLAFGFFGTNVTTNTGTAFRLRARLDSEWVSGASNCAHNHFEQIRGSAPVPIMFEMIGGCGRMGTSRLSGAMGTGSITTITLMDDAGDAGFSTLGGTVQINSEKFFYTGISGNDLTGVTRAQLSTTAASHVDTATVFTPTSTLANVCLSTFDHHSMAFGTTNGTQSAYLAHDTDNNTYNHIHAYRVTPGPPGTEYAYSWAFANAAVNTTDGTLTIGANDLAVGDRVRFIGTTRPPYGFLATASYYVVEIGGTGSGEWIKLSRTSGGAAIIPTDQGAGTLRVRRGGWTFELRGGCRENYGNHVECSGGIVVFPPTSANSQDTFYGYDMGNGEPEPDIMGSGGARLTWTTEGRLGTGWRVNADSTDPVLGGITTRHHFCGDFGGDTELFVKAPGRNDAGRVWVGASMVNAAGAVSTVYMGAVNGSVSMGSFTDTIVLFRKNNAEVFRLDATGQVQLAAGKRLYGGDGITLKTKSGSAVSDSDFTSPQDGMVAVRTDSPLLYFRVGTNDWHALDPNAGGSPSSPFTISHASGAVINSQGTGNSSSGLYNAYGKDGSGNILQGQFYASASQIAVGSATNHSAFFIQNGAEVFRANTSGQVQFASGKSIGFNINPTARLHFAAGITEADGILFGETEFYRIAADTLKLQAATGGGLAVTPATGVTSPKDAGAQGVFLNATGVIDINRAAGANSSALRVYSATSAASPSLRIDGDGTVLWSADATTRTVRLKPTAAQTLSIEGSADGTTWATAPILRFPTAASQINFVAGGTIAADATNGLKILAAGSDKLGFFGFTPKTRSAAMTARVAALTDSTAGTAGDTLAALGGITYTTDVVTLRNWGASLAAKYNNLKTRVDELSDRLNENATTGHGLISGTA